MTVSLIEHLIGHGVHGIFVAGTTGEFYGLGQATMRELFHLAVQTAAGRVPVYAGTGAITTREAIAAARLAADCGVDALSVLTPMFLNPTQEELFAHYEQIAESTNLPIVLYNNPPKTGVNLSADRVVRLAKLPNVVGIKDSSGDFTLAAEYIRRAGPVDFHVLAGRDTMIHGLLAAGAAGAIATCGKLAPNLIVQIYEKHRRGDWNGARQAQSKLVPLRLAVGMGTVPVVIKEALAMQGFDVGPCLPPVQPLSESKQDELRQLLAQLELLE